MGRHSGTDTTTRELFELRFAEAIAAPVAGSRLAARRAERLAEVAQINPVPVAHTPVVDTPSEAGMLEVIPESSLYQGVQTTSTPVRTLSSKRQTRAAITALAAAASGIVAVGAWSADNANTNENLAALTHNSDTNPNVSFEAVSFTVVVDGHKQTVTTHMRTVADALSEAGIVVGERDRVSVPMSSEIVEGMKIRIIRVEVRSVVAEEDQPFETIKENDASLAKGTEKVAREGSNGRVRNTYDVTYENGVEVGRELTLSVQLVDKVDRVVKVGTAANAAAAAGASASGPVVPAGEAQKIAHDKVLARGWGEDQFSCLVTLWNRESGWRTNAANPSGAYGIPQALPGSKMASAGADWQTNPATQIEWGLGYIAGRYGTPCGALGHSNSVGWY